MPVTNGGVITNASSGTVNNAGAPTNGVNEVQALTSTATGGTFAVTFVNPLNGKSVKSGPLAWNISAAALQTALRALSNMPALGVVVTGSTLDAAPLTLTYGGDLAGLNIAQVTVDNALATGGTVVPSTTTAGVSGTGRGAAPGGLLRDTTTPKLYQNAGTANTPNWQKVGTQT